MDNYKNANNNLETLLKTMKGKEYKTLEDFDAYICSLGRIQVSKEAKFTVSHDFFGNNRIYFLNSENFLPLDATASFLTIKKEEIFPEKENEINYEKE